MLPLFVSLPIVPEFATPAPRSAGKQAAPPFFSPKIGRCC